MADPQLPSWVQGILPPDSPFRTADVPPPVVSPRQTAQPRLAVSHDPPPPFVGPEETVAAPSPWTKAATIGPPQMGEHYTPAGLGQILASDQPLKLLAEHVTSTFGGGPGRPRSLADADPIGLTTWEQGKGPMPLFMASTAEVPGAPEGPGLYSRADRLAESLPAKGVHPNKLAGLVKQLNPDEVNYRQLGQFMADAQQRPVVTPQELRAHLDAHPAPWPVTKTLNAPPPLRQYADQLDDLAQQLYDWDYGELSSSEREAVRAHHSEPTKWDEYQLPGGENYRERIFTLPDQGGDAAVQAAYARHRELLSANNQFWEEQVGPHIRAGRAVPQAVADEAVQRERQIGVAAQQWRSLKDHQQLGGFQSHAFPDKNILAWTRYNERTLPLPGLRPNEELEPIIQQAVGAKTPSSIASGAPGRAVQLGLISPEEAQQFGAAKGFYGVEAPGSRGRQIEEVQSDWHQRGKEEGYQTPDTQAAFTQAKQAEQTATNALRAHEAQFTEAWHAAHPRPPYTPMSFEQYLQDFVPPEYQTPDMLEVNQRLYKDAEASNRYHHEAAPRRAASTALQVDPTRERLVQEALDAGHRVHELQRQATSGIPDAPFKTTWEDLALKHHLLDVARDPTIDWLGITGSKAQITRYPGLADLVSKVEYEPRTNMLYGYDVHYPTLQTVSKVVEPEELQQYLGKEPAARLRAQIAAQVDHNQLPSISGPDLSVGGQGMVEAYDRRLPNKLKSLAQLFGGTVEPFDIPHAAPADWVPDGAPDTGPGTTSSPGWILCLTPEMKARILQRGFPLLSAAPLLGGAALEAFRQGQVRDHVGNPPPPAPGAP